jgi:hypothetical protein
MPPRWKYYSPIIGLSLLYFNLAASQIISSDPQIQSDLSVMMQDSTSFPYGYEISINYYKIDAGPWLGLRVGAQPEGGPVTRQWAVSGYYELRSPNSASIVLDYHLWRNSVITTNGSDNKSAMYGIISAALKFRYNYARLSVGVQGGVGTGIWLAPYSLHYGLSAEYCFSNSMAISVSHKRYWWGDFGPFVFLGISKKI